MIDGNLKLFKFRFYNKIIFKLLQRKKAYYMWNNFVLIYPSALSGTSPARGGFLEFAWENASLAGAIAADSFGFATAHRSSSDMRQTSARKIFDVRASRTQNVKLAWLMMRRCRIGAKQNLSQNDWGVGD